MLREEEMKAYNQKIQAYEGRVRACEGWVEECVRQRAADQQTIAALEEQCQRQHGRASLGLCLEQQVPPKPATLNPHPSTRNPQPSTLNP